MLVFDLCSGTGSATVAFKEAGHTVVTIDIERISDTLTERIDLMFVTPDYLLEKYGAPDFVWMSPPCTYFSLGNISANWDTFALCRRLHCGGVVRPGGGKYQPYWHCSDPKCERRIPPDACDKQYIPKSRQAKESIALVNHLVHLAYNLEHTANYYRRDMYWVMENPVGMMRHLNITSKLQRQTVTYCQYGANRQKPTDLFGRLPKDFVAMSCRRGDDCHVPTGRGSKVGTQGMNAVTAGRIPYGLSLAMLEAVTYAQRESA